MRVLAACVSSELSKHSTNTITRSIGSGHVALKAGNLQYNPPDVRYMSKRNVSSKFIHGRNLFTSGKWPLKVEVLSRFKVIRVQPVDTDKNSMAIANSHPVCLSWINSIHTEMLTVHC